MFSRDVRFCETSERSRPGEAFFSAQRRMTVPGIATV
jgi:hypothetical protein